LAGIGGDRVRMTNTANRHWIVARCRANQTQSAPASMEDAAGPQGDATIAAPRQWFGRLSPSLRMSTLPELRDLYGGTASPAASCSRSATRLMQFSQFLPANILFSFGGGTIRQLAPIRLPTGSLSLFARSLRGSCLLGALLQRFLCQFYVPHRLRDHHSATRNYFIT
jgi:hypothetical protein